MDKFYILKDVYMIEEIFEFGKMTYKSETTLNSSPRITYSEIDKIPLVFLKKYLNRLKFFKH